MYRPTEDKSFMSRTEMIENIVSLLGGRVSEKLVLDDISTGASNDIERATKIARNMVTKYGMSERVGTITLGQNQEEVFLGRDFAQSKEYSEETAAIIDEEVKRIIDEAYNKAKTIYFLFSFIHLYKRWHILRLFSSLREGYPCLMVPYCSQMWKPTASYLLSHSDP